MEDLSASLARCFTTRPGEEDEIPVDDKPAPVSYGPTPIPVVGRVVSQKVLSGLSLKINITRLLQSVRGFAFQDVGDNKFVLKFNHKLDCTHALEGSPCLVDR